MIKRKYDEDGAIKIDFFVFVLTFRIDYIKDIYHEYITILYIVSFNIFIQNACYNFYDLFYISHWNFIKKKRIKIIESYTYFYPIQKWFL